MIQTLIRVQKVILSVDIKENKSMEKTIQSKKSLRFHSGFMKLNYILNLAQIILKKKNKKVKKKLTKTKQKIIIIEISEIEEKTSIENEMDEILGDLNPRYFEEGITFKEAKERIQASVGSKFDFYRVY